MGALDLVDELALALARLEVLVARDGVRQREDLVDADGEVARLDPAEDLLRAHQQLVAVGDIVEKLGPRDEGRLLDEPQHGEGRHGARRVAKRDEDAAAREAIDRDVDCRLADAVDDRLAARPARDLHHLRDN
eukprot:3989034-Prymnesium_polylepis.1